MAQASGIAARVAIQKEPSFGVAPAIPKMTTLTLAAYGESLTKTIDELTSDAINPNRGILSSRNGQIKIGGQIPFELPVQNSEFVMYGVFGGYVQTTETGGKFKKVFKRYSTVPSFVVEKAFTDINQYFLYSGCMFNNINLTVDPAQKVSGTVELVGKDATVSQTAFDAAPLTLEHKMFTGVVDGAILEGGIGAKFKKLTVTITNGLTAQYIIGEQSADYISLGQAECTGEITIQFQDVALYNKWANETQTDLKLTFTNGGNSTEFYFPVVKLTGDGAPQIASRDGIDITFKWRALVDQATLLTDCQVTIINDFDFDTEVQP